MAERGLRMSEKILLPSEGESVAIALGKQKTAALCYDRVWSEVDRYCSAEENMPDSIRCFGGTPFEAEVDGVLDSFREMKMFEGRKHSLDSDRKIRGLLALARFSSLRKSILDRLGLPDKLDDAEKRAAIDSISREVSKSFSTEHGIPMVPIYEFTESRDCEYQEGDREAVVTTVSSLEIVDEEALKWEEVLEFRADEENKRKYKRFLHWLDKEMVSKSKSFVEDEISIRLEDYEKALKKHGIKTVVGEVSEVLAGGGLIAALSEPKYGLLTVGALTIGKLVIKIAKVLLDYDDVEKGPNSEISWVYEVRKLTE